MEGLNLEITTCCPLKCPQCYCTLEGGKHLDLEIAKNKLKEGAEHGVKTVHISGGETMCYPHIFELVEYAATCCETVNVALSGYNFDEKVLNQLDNAGVSGIFISLNGSTEKINSLTRDGYALALKALQILKDYKFKNTYINWVMHSNNAEDFENVLKIAELYDVKNLVILSFKPDAKHELLTFPTAGQIIELSKQLKKYKGKVKIMVETCFSQLLAVLKDTKLFGNLNVGPYKGCRAGIYNYCINVDGKYSPCRHLDYIEDFETLEEYLSSSEIIRQIKDVENNVAEPCSNCYYNNNCRPCLAVNSKLNGKIYKGHEICGLWKS